MDKETLKEALEKQFPLIKELEDSIEYTASIAERKLAFMFGAKWMEEQMEKLKGFDTWKEWKNQN